MRWVMGTALPEVGPSVLGLKRFLRQLPSAWLRQPTGVSEAEKDIEVLRDRWGKDSFLYQWLCACAVYPLLRFDLTMHLGAEMAREGTRDGAKGISEIEQRSPTEQEAMTLARLTWFRQGWMPEELRALLVRELAPFWHPLIRRALERLLFNLLATRTASRVGVIDLKELKEPDWEWRGELQAALRAAPPAAPEGDLLFARFMMGGSPGPTGLAFDRKLADLVGVRRARWVDANLILGTLFTLSVAALIWIGADPLLRPLVERRVEQLTEVQGPEMVELNGGSFLMGSPASEAGRFSDEGPQHAVKVDRFAIGKYEVTFEEWNACVGDGGCTGNRPGTMDIERRATPVFGVSWDDAQAYVQWLSKKTGKSYRLPSEAEWEYAARAGTTTANWWGDGWSAKLANNGDKAVAVGSYPPNPWGLYDTAGNVWEWVEDCWHESYSGAPSDGRSWVDGKGCDQRVVRGGSWVSLPEFLRSAFRFRFPPGFRYGNFGFRVARTLAP